MNVENLNGRDDPVRFVFDIRDRPENGVPAVWGLVLADCVRAAGTAILRYAEGIGIPEDFSVNLWSFGRNGINPLTGESIVWTEPGMSLGTLRKRMGWTADEDGLPDRLCLSAYPQPRRDSPDGEAVPISEIPWPEAGRVIKRYAKARDRALCSLDRGTIEEFMRDHGLGDLADAPYEIFWHAVYEVLWEAAETPGNIREKAAGWLRARGYEPGQSGEGQ